MRLILLVPAILLVAFLAVGAFELLSHFAAAFPAGQIGHTSAQVAA